MRRKGERQREKGTIDEIGEEKEQMKKNRWAGNIRKERGGGWTIK